MADDERGYADGWWFTGDGLRLHYRDYPGSADRLPILCVPGLTRNARDFEGVAARLAGRRRVIVAELRGRGMSEYAADPLSYLPPVYLQDLVALIASLGLARLVLFGTSLGGLLAMLLATIERPLLGGVLLNDVGPVLAPSGMARIANYVGRAERWPDWQAAADAIAATHGEAFPDYGAADWLRMAHRLCRAEPGGSVVQDYDPRIAEPFKLPAPDVPIDLWPALQALSGMPSLLLRGALSDVLSAETAERMAHALPDIELVTLPRIGHAPTLEEPEAIAAIDRLLARID